MDERALEMCFPEELSIGDYVLTGGETAALVVIDAVSRLLPGVLGSEESAEDESFTTGLLEYPQYTRPREFRGREVPEVLLNGNHALIGRWRRENRRCGSPANAARSFWKRPRWTKRTGRFSKRWKKRKNEKTPPHVGTALLRP